MFSFINSHVCHLKRFTKDNRKFTEIALVVRQTPKLEIVGLLSQYLIIYPTQLIYLPFV